MAKITWAGQSCFHISASTGKDSQVNIVIDPYGENIGLKNPHFEADVLLLTHDHDDHNNRKGVKGDPFIIDGPGEYEVGGVFIKGIPSFHDDVNGKERGKNTIYVIEAEGVMFCHLGDFGQKQLTDEQVGAIGSPHVVMVPVGGTYTLDGHEAVKVVGQIDPRIVIPMHYAIPKLTVDLDGVETFLKSMGMSSVEPQDKLVVKLSSLPKEGALEVVTLKP